MSENIGELTEVAMAKESVYGTAEAVFTKGVLVNPDSFSIPNETTAEKVPELSGVLMKTRSSAGAFNFPVNFSFWLDPGDDDALGVGEMLAGLFGNDTLTGASDPFTHTFTLLQSAEPLSYTIFRKTGTLTKVYAGFRVATIKLTVTAGEPRILVEITGICQSEATSVLTPSLTFADEPVLVPSQATLKIDSSANNDFESVEVTLGRVQEGVHTVSASRNINRLIDGDAFMDISLGGIEPTDETLRDKFKALHDLSTEQFRFDLEIVASASRKIVITADKCFFQTWEDPTHSEGLHRISATGTALRGSSFQTVLTNGVPTAYDA